MRKKKRKTKAHRVDDVDDVAPPAPGPDLPKAVRGAMLVAPVAHDAVGAAEAAEAVEAAVVVPHAPAREVARGVVAAAAMAVVPGRAMFERARAFHAAYPSRTSSKKAIKSSFRSPRSRLAPRALA
jgi:hypothetical protein